MEYTILNMLVVFSWFFMIQLSLCQNEISPIRIRAEVGSVVQLPCPLSFNFSRVRWYRGSGLILTYNLDFVTYGEGFSSSDYGFVIGNNSLIIESVSVIDDALKFACGLFTFSSFQWIEYFYQPSVYTQPASVTFLGQTPNITENASIELTCEVPSVYPNNSLQVHLILGLTRICNATLTYRNNTDGTYQVQATCTVQLPRNADGQHVKCEADFRFQSLNPVIVNSSAIPVTVRYCDKINITSGTDDSPIENSEVTFSCSTQCNPIPSMSLVAGSSLLHSAISETLQQTHRIQREDHRKSFKCVIPGSSNLDSNELYIFVRFHARQVFLTTNSTGVIDVGSPVTLTCITDEAYPTASVVWSWSGSGGVPGSVADSEVNGTCCGGAKKTRSLRAFSIGRAHNLKIVTCTSGSVSNSTTLNVKFSPFNTTIEYLTSLAVIENSSIRFRCVTDVLNPKESLTGLLWKIDSTSLLNATVPVFTSASSGYSGHTSSSIVTFRALRTHDRKSLTCTAEWDNQNMFSSQSSYRLTVYYLPETNVTITGDLNENRSCSLTCSLSGGNPNSTTDTTEYTFSWFWKANADQLETNILHSQQSLSFNPVTHHQSGLYRCEASSVAGTARGEALLSINYAPVGINIHGNNKTIYAGYNTSTQLDLTVHSFPTGGIVDFIWTKNEDSVASQNEILTNNQTRSTVNISSVSEPDYGYYTVNVSNGGGRRSVFYVELKLQGKPTPAFEINTLSISYRQIILSFRPGMDGGRSQTLKVEYKKVNTDSSLNVENVDNPVHGIQQNVTIARWIEPSSEYEIVIISDNSFEGSPTRAAPLYVNSKDKPSVKEKGLVIYVTGEEFVLRWPAISLEAGDSLYVRQCGGDECLIHDVSGRIEGMFHRANGTSFSLLHYQGSDLVLELNFVKQKVPPNGSAGTTSNAGVIAGSVISVTFIIAVVTTVGLIYWNKFRMPGRKKSDTNVYIKTTHNNDIDDAAQGYDEVNVNHPSAEYTRLTALRSPSVCENFILLKNFQSDIIHSGHFLTYQCRLEHGLCAIKSLKDIGDACYIHEVNWILAQTVAMKNLPLHRNIAEIVACNSDIETPLFVTKLAVRGDLKSALASCDRNTADGIIVSVRNALDIVEGMNFLSKYQLLHYELSTSHVLLGHNDECKIINFASAESVRARQKISLKLNDLSCLPWLAPECLISAEQHCTASDVWSFGVLLYELILSGGNPYKDMAFDEIGEFALQGKTLQIPIEGKYFGEIITKCWNFEPADRPDWTQLKEMLLLLHAQFAASAGVYETVRFEGPEI